MSSISKKTTAIVLSLLIAVSMFVALPVSVGASMIIGDFVYEINQSDNTVSYGIFKAFLSAFDRFGFGYTA